MKSTEFSHIHAKQSFQRKLTSLEWPTQLATHVWLTHCQGATEGADGQVAFMRQLHQSSFRVAQSSGSELLRTAFQPFLAEWNHKGCAGHYGTACVSSSTYYWHIYHLSGFVKYPLAFPLNWKVSGLIAHPLDRTYGAALVSIYMYIFFCWWLCKMSLIFLAPCPILLFSTLAGLLYCFSWCAVRERGQPHPSAEWHSMRRRKEVEKSCLVLFLMSKSMHLSFKGCKREKKTEKLLGLQGPGQNTHTEAVTSCYE